MCDNLPEIWKAIPGFPGYDVSSQGRIRSYWRKSKPTAQGYTSGWFVADSPQKILRHGENRDYLNIQLNGRKMVKIHQLVLLTFVGPCPPGMQGCHNDGNAAHNCLTNLRWDTPASNRLDKVKHGTQPCGEKINTAKLSESQVIEIRQLATQGYRAAQLSRMFSVSYTNVRAILRGQTWKHI